MTHGLEGETEVEDGRADARGSGRFRELAAVAGLGLIGSVAGCSTEPGSADDGASAPAEPDPAPGDDAGSSESSSPSGVDSPTQTGSGSPASQPTATRSAETCRQRAAEVESELAAVAEAMERVEAAFPMLRARRKDLEAVAELFEPPDPAVERQALAVGTAAREAVVFLDLGGGSATGWYIDGHHIVTNAHNVDGFPAGGPEAATAWTLGGDSYRAETVGAVTSLDPDVAVLRTDERAPATLPTGTAPDGGSGEPLVQVGHPGAVGNWVISFGNLRGRSEMLLASGETLSILESSVPGRQGVSGSPVLNLDGEVVGLTYGGFDVQTRRVETRPFAAEPIVYDRPIAALSYANHVPIDVVETYYEEWT